VSGEEVKKNTIRDVVAYMEQQPKGTRLYLLSPIILPEGRTLREQLVLWLSQGFSRLLIDGDTVRLDAETWKQAEGHDAYLLVDRVVVDHEQATSNRFADSVQTAFFEGRANVAFGSISMRKCSPSASRQTEYSLSNPASTSSISTIP